MIPFLISKTNRTENEGLKVYKFDRILCGFAPFCLGLVNRLGNRILFWESDNIQN